MDRIAFIRENSQQVRGVTKNLIKHLPPDLWYEKPEVLSTHMAWQVGHLITSQLFNSVTAIVGKDARVPQQMPLREYLKTFTMGSSLEQASIRPTPAELLSNLDFVHQLALDTLDGLDANDLDEPLFPSGFKHPIAKTKYDALCWSFKHEMWHVGQMSVLCRALGHPVDYYGLS